MAHKHSWSMLLCLFVACTRAATLPDRPPDDQLIFHDDFSTFDFSTWKHEITMGGGGNWEFEMYVNSRDNSYVRDGVLFLKPTLAEDKLGKKRVEGLNPNWPDNTVDLWGTGPANQCTGNQFYGCFRTATALNPINPIQSARIRTAESFSFQYGRIEVRAALPRGKWLWPAIWMLPRDEAYGTWPASGEIDIMESRGNPPDYTNAKGQPLGCDTVGSTVHWGPAYNHDAYPLTTSTHALSSSVDRPCPFSDAFHTFGMIWTPENMTFFVDDLVTMVVPLGASRDGTTLWQRGSRAGYWSRKMQPGDVETEGFFQDPWRGGSESAPFDQEFFIVLNLAVGGISGGSSPAAYWPDGRGGKPWTNVVPPGGASAASMFLQAKNEWLPSWRGNASLGQTVGETASLRIDDIRVWRLDKPQRSARALADASFAVSTGGGGLGPDDGGAARGQPNDPYLFPARPLGKGQSDLLWAWGGIWLVIGACLGVSMAKCITMRACPCIRKRTELLNRTRYGTVRF